MDPLTFNDAVPAVTIGGRRVGAGEPCFIIAEAGVNHNGRADLALALVDAAHAAGADCVKFQTFTAEGVASARAGKAPYQRVTTGSDGAQIEMLRRLELPHAAYTALMSRCAELGIQFLSTPYSIADADFLADLDVAAFKVASAQIIEKELLVHIASKGKPVILSTGMATLAETAAAVQWMRAAGNNDLVLLQCTTDYPARVDDANLRVLQTLRHECRTVTGYSDHTEGPTCCIAAVALGASVVEKHLTLDRAMEGPDHRASADPVDFAALTRAVRQAEASLGTADKHPSARETPNIPFMRRSLIAARELLPGTVITREMVEVKRPAGGIPPADLEQVIGARVRQRVQAGEAVQWSDLDR